MSDPGIGHNVGEEATPDPLVEGLREKHQKLFDAVADLELKSFDLPDECKTQEDHDAIAGMVAAARKQAREAERVRKDEKDDYLRGGQRVDKLFKEDAINVLLSRADRLEARLKPYLDARAAEEEARRRQEAAEATRRANEERLRAQQAADEAEAARGRQREAEEQVRESSTPQERAAAAEDLRKATVAADQHQEVVDDASKAAKQADRQAAGHEKALAGGVGTLSKTVGGGASSGLQKRWSYRIDDEEATRKSLGPLGPMFTLDQIAVALTRMARDNHNTIGVPGVVFFEVQEAKVRGR